MSETCRTCKWWQASHPFDTTEPDEWKRERMPEIAPGRVQWGWCNALPDTGANEKGEHKVGVRAYTADGSMYSSSLNTRHDFGCVEHEPESSTS